MIDDFHICSMAFCDLNTDLHYLPFQHIQSDVRKKLRNTFVS